MSVGKAETAAAYDWIGAAGWTTGSAGMVSLLAVTILGVTFSGTYALIAAVIIVVLIGAGWFLVRRRP
jgi:hypothetical protein